MEFLFHKLHNGGRLKNGLSFRFGESGYEFMLKNPLPIIKHSIWRDFETLRILKGLKILHLVFYFRVRSNYIKNQWPNWRRMKRFVFYINFGWTPIIEHLIITKKDLENTKKQWCSKDKPPLGK